MRIVDALEEVLKENGSLTYKEAYAKIVEKDLYRFGAKDPESAVNAKLRCHCEGLDFPGASPVKLFKIVGKKGKRNLYALIQNEEVHEDNKTKETKNAKQGKKDEDDCLPEEKIETAYSNYKEDLKKEILNHIRNCHPSFFEKMVVDLLLKMGYGADDLSGRVLGRSHDGGIDGEIYEDKLGLSKILIQAKRYAEGNNIGSDPLKAFVGAMENVQKGVFITTSSFTKEAIKYAEKQQQKNLKLIDGDLLSELMIEYEIGLEKIKTYSVFKINEDFFE